MKVRLLKKLRRAAKKEYYIIKLSGNGYMIPGCLNNVYSTDFERTVVQCDMLRREFIIKSLKKIGVKRHKKIY